MKESSLVSSRLSVIEEVQSTATHIILTKYKDHGTMFVKMTNTNGQVIYESSFYQPEGTIQPSGIRKFFDIANEIEMAC